MSDYLCMKCQKNLQSDEIALHRRLYGIASRKYMCLDCQAQYLSCTREHLEHIIEMYHKSGICVLFAKQ